MTSFGRLGFVRRSCRNCLFGSSFRKVWIWRFEMVVEAVARKNKMSKEATEKEKEEEVQHVCIDGGDTTQMWMMKKKKKKAKQEYSLLPFHALPDYLKDNEYILDYYRADWPIKQALLSIFSWHNETLNIWTHLAGFLLFLALTISNATEQRGFAEFTPFFPTSLQEAFKTGNVSGWYMVGDVSPIQSSPRLYEHEQAARWPFFVFLGGSMFCLLTSSISHLLCCHSRKLNLFLWRLDYAGISVMIATSFDPPVYYVFQCTPVWQFVYLSGITTMGVITLLILVAPAFSSTRFRSFRAMLFLAMGFSGIIPAAHALTANWNEPYCLVTLAYEFSMAFFYATGTVFYIKRIPEKWKPGLFDITGHSHQIFHLFVIAGALAHYCATLIFLKWRDLRGCDILR